MNKNAWVDLLAWVGAIGLALALAVAAPSDTRVMGHVPDLATQTLDNQTALAVPNGLPAERTLALITFKGSQRSEVDSWITGLGLKDNSIAWIRMAVLNDPGSLEGREAVHTKLLARYTSDTERSKLAPVFTDRESFIRAAGLNSSEQVYAVVLSRTGEVLARAEGKFDQQKADALRETLLQPQH